MPRRPTIAMRMDVNEARRHGTSISIDFADATPIDSQRVLDNVVIAHGNVSRTKLITSSVDRDAATSCRTECSSVHVRPALPTIGIRCGVAEFIAPRMEPA